MPVPLLPSNHRLDRLARYSPVEFVPPVNYTVRKVRDANTLGDLVPNWMVAPLTPRRWVAWVYITAVPDSQGALYWPLHGVMPPGMEVTITPGDGSAAFTAPISGYAVPKQADIDAANPGSRLTLVGLGEQVPHAIDADGAVFTGRTGADPNLYYQSRVTYQGDTANAAIEVQFAADQRTDGVGFGFPATMEPGDLTGGFEFGDGREIWVQETDSSAVQIGIEERQGIEQLAFEQSVTLIARSGLSANGIITHKGVRFAIVSVTDIDRTGFSRIELSRRYLGTAF